MQLQENAQTDRRTEGRTDRPYFIGPFWLPPGSKKEYLSYLLFGKIIAYKMIS